LKAVGVLLGVAFNAPFGDKLSLALTVGGFCFFEDVDEVLALERQLAVD